MTLDEFSNLVEILLCLSSIAKKNFQEYFKRFSLMGVKKSGLFVNILSTWNLKKPDNRDLKSTSYIFIDFKDNLCYIF